MTWNDPRNAAKILRGDDRRILHLHGHWKDPDSVVLGIRSYEALLGDVYIQEAMRALGMTKSFLFVGCGDEGLADPNFGNFLAWLKEIEAAADVEHRHYRLARRKDRVQPQGKVFPLVYGEEYSDLPAFLARLVPEPQPGGGEGTAKKTTVLRRHPAAGEHRPLSELSGRPRPRP